MVFYSSIVTSGVSLLLTLAGIAIVILIMGAVTKTILKLIIGLIMNAAFGFGLLYLLNYMFGISFTMTTAIKAAVLLFGLPAVGTLVLLKLVGGVALFI